MMNKVDLQAVVALITAVLALVGLTDWAVFFATLLTLSGLTP